MRRTGPRTTIVLFLAAALCACGRGGEGSKQPETPQEVMTALRNDRAEVDAATDRIMTRLQSWNQAHPGEKLQFTDVFASDLDEKEQHVLEDLISKEKDPTYRGLLREIVAERDKIDEMDKQVWELQNKLPGRYHVAARGDTHYDIAYEYLTKDVGLSEAEARRHLADINLFSDLWPGHRVYLYYDRENDLFATWVTSGEAGRSPLAVERAARRRLIEDRDAALARAATLAGERDSLSRELIGIRKDVVDLKAERQRLESEVSGLRVERDTVQKGLAAAEAERDLLQNALFYHVASEQDLKRQGVVRDSLFTFPQLEDPDGVAYDRSLDLREGRTVELQAGDYGLPAIRKVTLFPKFFEEGRDYRITRRGAGAVSLEILAPDSFRGRKVLISLRS